MSETNALLRADELTAAAAEFRRKLDAGTHTRETVREVIVTDENLKSFVEDLAAKVEALRAALDALGPPAQAGLPDDVRDPLMKLAELLNTIQGERQVEQTAFTELKQRVDDLGQQIATTPLTPQNTNIEISVPGSLASRIEALEQHAGAADGLSSALNMVLQLAQQSSARIASLETEAIKTHATVATITPTLLALSARRAS